MINLKKIIFIIVFIFYSICSISLAEIVKDIQVKGNERVSEKSIKMFSKIKIGDDINNDNLNEILKNVYESNFFKNVSVSFENNLLTIFVEESSLVESVIIKGPKSKTLISDLKKNLKVKSRSSYNEIQLINDKKEIIKLLQERGFFFAKVDF